MGFGPTETQILNKLDAKLTRKTKTWASTFENHEGLNKDINTADALNMETHENQKDCLLIL